MILIEKIHKKEDLENICRKVYKMERKEYNVIKLQKLEGRDTLQLL